MISSLLVNNFKADDDIATNDLLQFIDHNRHFGFKEAFVEPNVAYRFQGNFYGLLRELNIDLHLYLPTLYVNGFTNPVDFKGSEKSIKIATYPTMPT